MGNKLIKLTDVIQDGDKRSAKVSVSFVPEVGASQRVVLLLNERAADKPDAYTFNAPGRDADGHTVTIPIKDVKAAEYLVRVQVDGAESPLIVDTNPDSPTFNQYIGPTLAIGVDLGNRLRATVRLRATPARVYGTVTVNDENSKPFVGASVLVTWSLPNGKMRKKRGDTKQNGVAEFRVSKEKEEGTYTYTLTITDVTEAGYTFDPDQSDLSESITITIAD